MKSEDRAHLESLVENTVTNAAEYFKYLEDETLHLPKADSPLVQKLIAQNMALSDGDQVAHSRYVEAAAEAEKVLTKLLDLGAGLHFSHDEEHAIAAIRRRIKSLAVPENYIQDLPKKPIKKPK